MTNDRSGVLYSTARCSHIKPTFCNVKFTALVEPLPGPNHLRRPSSRWTRITKRILVSGARVISKFLSPFGCQCQLYLRISSVILTQTRSQLEGVRHPRPFTELIDKPELRFHGVQSSYARLPNVQESLPVDPNVLHSALSDLFVTCQLLADNKPLTIPFQTSHKTFKNSYTSAFNLTLPKSLADFLYQVERMDHATDPLLRPPIELTDHLYCMGYSGTSRSGAGGWHSIPVVQQKMVCCFPDLFCRRVTDGQCLGDRTLRRGKHRLLLWPGKEADGSVETTTPSKSGDRDEMGRLEKVRYSLLADG